MKFWRILLSLLAFQLEVRVHASSALESAMWDPPTCGRSPMSSECRVQAGERSMSIEGEHAGLKMEAHALLERKDGRWRLLRGSLRAKEVVVDSIFGGLARPSAEVWLLDNGSEQVIIRAVEGVALVRLRDGSTLEIPEGFEAWIGPRATDGTSLHGVPVPIPLGDHLRRWASLDALTRDVLKEGADELKARWKNRTETAAALYDEVAKRRLASIAEEERLKKASQEAAARQREKERALLRETAFGK